MDRCPDPVGTKERAELERTEEEDKGRGTETDDDTEECSRVVAVVRILTVGSVEGVVGVQVTEKTAVGEGVADSIQDEDGDDEQCEDLIRESGGVLDVPGDVEEGCQEAVPDQPNGRPCVQRLEGHVHAVRNVREGGREGQDWSCRTDDRQRHTTDQRVCATDPRRCEHSLDGTDEVVGDTTVRRTEGQRRRNDRDEDEESDSDGLLVEVGHLFDPPRQDGLADVTDDTFTPHAGLGRFDFSGTLDEFVVVGQTRFRRRHDER
mmetsp:Transcript_60912/g.149146  ORF Transcript_60912/g.149146 Transcript_60912/m.149146 type:complete len:263 (-) Transcript_60912:927-1715(-)